MTDTKPERRSIWRFEKRLVPMKIMYFWSHAAAAALIPFFVTYYVEWGLTATELSIIQAAVTFLAFAARPIIGRIADLTQYYRACLAICFIWCAILHLPHMFLPKMPLLGPGIANSSGNYSVIGDFSKESNRSLEALIERRSVVYNTTVNCETETGCAFANSSDLPSSSSDSEDSSSWFSHSRTSVFAMMMAVRLLASLGQSPSMSLVDTFGYATAQSDKKLWGRQRCWSTFGWAFSTVVIGVFLHFANGSHYYLFVLAGSFYLISAISVAFISPLYQHKHPETLQEKNQKIKSRQQLHAVIRRPEVVIYLLFTIVNGILLAMEYNFLFLFLKESGADELLIGLHQAVDCVAELPMFFFSGYIVSYLGYVPCFCISFLAYVVRLLSYSFLDHPLYLVLLVELTHGFSYSLFLAAGTGYADALTPPGYAATLQGIFHSFYFSLGIGIAELSGGYLYPAIGARWFFRCGALLAIVCAGFYYILWLVWLRHLERRDIVKAVSAENIAALISGVQTEASATLVDCNRIDMAHIDDVPPSADHKDTLIEQNDCKKHPQL